MAVEAKDQVTKRKWFRKGDTDQVDDETLKLANKAKDESEKLKQLAYDSLKGVDVRSQLQSTQAGLVDQLKGYADSKSVTIAAAGSLEEALTARADWDAYHGHGYGKFGSHLQRFATGLASFMGAYSGIINAVKSAGGPYGEAGYQAISVLLIVAVNKNKNDEFVSKELEGIVDCFPRVNLMAQLYPDQRIERRVLEVHNGVISFARDATAYFLHASKRFCKSLLPQEMAVKGRIDDIKRSLAELNAWSTAFMHVKTQELVEGKNQLLEDNRELKSKIDELQLKLKGMEQRDLQRQKQDELDALEAARASLGRPDEMLHTNLKEILRNQAMVFPSTSHLGKPSTKYLQMSLELLGKQESYQTWFASSHGCLLVLGGKTKPEGQLQKSGYSWLSPAATDMAVSLGKNEELIVAFFSCHPKSWLSSEDEPLARDLVAGLLFQVLTAEPAVLKEDFQRQLTSLHIEKWIGKRDKETLDVVKKSVLDLFRKASEKRWIYLIIDRAERCKAGLRLLLDWFHNLVEEPGCRIKVMVVFDTVKADMGEQDWEDLAEESQGRVYSRTGWNQDKLGFEKSPLRTPHISP